MPADTAVSISAQDALALLLAEDPQASAEVPRTAGAIRIQEGHMALVHPPLEVLRRLRDVAVRLRPRVAIEVGAGIGGLSAWLLDAWTAATEPPAAYRLVEAGARFGVILQRVVESHDAAAWARVVGGDWVQLAEATRAASLVAGDGAGTDLAATVPRPVDLAIVQGSEHDLAARIRATLPLLSSAGMLLALEPATPLADEAPGEGSGAVAAWDTRVAGFQAWIDLVRELSRTRTMAFVPVGDSTLVAVMRRRPSS